MARPRLILDSGGVSAIVDGEERALAWLALATRRGYLIGIPAPVLTETMTGRLQDATIHRILQPMETCLPTTAEIATEAGAIRFRTRSANKTVDAIVVATAARYQSSIILTSDPKDIQLLANERPDAKLTVRSVNASPRKND